MASKPRSRVAPVEESTYRCPGCGEMVDHRCIDEVLRHHQHVLHPPSPCDWFGSARERVRSASNATSTGEPKPLIGDSSALTADARLRRYGH